MSQELEVRFIIRVKKKFTFYIISWNPKKIQNPKKNSTPIKEIAMPFLYSEGLISRSTK